MSVSAQNISRKINQFLTEIEQESLDDLRPDRMKTWGAKANVELAMGLLRDADRDIALGLARQALANGQLTP